MQTRRDQLQAYRFQNRRALAALVTGQPNVLEPPMRRLTVTTLSGIMIAILVIVVFGLLAAFRPSSGTNWKQAGAVIIDRDTNADYVYLDGVLHPVLNYTSAVLAVSSTQSVTTVHVSSSDLSGAKYGKPIGIADVPSSLPGASALVSWPMTVCSRDRPTSTGGVQAQVSLHLGKAVAARAVPATESVLVASARTGAEYLLYDGRRLPVGSALVANALEVNSVSAVRVGTAFLDSVPLGPAFAPPPIPGLGSRSPVVSVNGHATTIGQLVYPTGTTDGYRVVLADGVAPLTKTQAAVLSTLRTPAGRPIPAPLATSSFALTQLPTSRAWTQIAGSFATLPTSVPALDGEAATRSGVCAVYGKDDTNPTFSAPPSELKAYNTGTAQESARSAAGLADEVDVRPTYGVLAVPADRSSNVVVISDQGIQYAVTSSQVLNGFGYKNTKPTQMPPQLLALVPRGPALDPAAALRPVS